MRKNFIKCDGGRKAAGFKGVTCDCVCRSIAIVTGRPYLEVYNELKVLCKKERRLKTNRRSCHRTGIHTGHKWFKDWMSENNFVWIKSRRGKLNFSQDNLPTGRLIVFIEVYVHYAAVIDGIVYDTWNQYMDDDNTISGYWKLDKEN